MILDTTFVQGRTHRWGVAWSYDPSLIPTRELVTQKRKLTEKRKADPFIVNLPNSQDSNGYQRAVKWMEDTLNKLKVLFVFCMSLSFYLSFFLDRTCCY